MWMGGVIPLGYRLAERKLHIEPDDAAIVRIIFTRYLELGSALRFVSDLQDKGVQSRVRTKRHGRSGWSQWPRHSRSMPARNLGVSWTTIADIGHIRAGRSAQKRLRLRATDLR